MIDAEWIDYWSDPKRYPPKYDEEVLKQASTFHAARCLRVS